MRLLGVLVALLALISGRALAQVSLGGGGDKSPMELLDDQEQARRKQADKDYQSTMKRLRSGNANAAVPVDPWGSVREQPQPANKR
jgi:hypothetical protein